MEVPRSLEAEEAGTGTDGETEAARGPALDGVNIQLAQLSPNTILTRKALAHMFGVGEKTIWRRAKKGELPEPWRMGGKPCWFAGAILEHFRARQEAAQREAERERERVARYADPI